MNDVATRKVVAELPGPEPTPPKFPLRLVALAVITGGLIALSVVVAVPFLPAITWGIALAIMSWPMHRYIRARITSPTAAASWSTLVVFFVIVLPALFVVYEIGRETSRSSEKTGTTPDRLISRENLENVPGMDRVVAWMDRAELDVEKEIRQLVTHFLPDVPGLAESSLATVLQFLVTLYILFYVFRDRGEFMDGLRELLPLTAAESERLFHSASDSVHANLYATVVTSLINSVSGTLLFWFLGMPAPVLWGLVMFVLSIVPIVGIGMIWVPVALYLFVSGSWFAGAVLVAWGLSTAVFIDYVVYAKIAGDRMRMHPVPALIAFLGGLAVFGLSGVILGPAVFAMTDALLDLWRRRMTGAGSAMKDAV